MRTSIHPLARNDWYLFIAGVLALLLVVAAVASSLLRGGAARTSSVQTTPVAKTVALTPQQQLANAVASSVWELGVQKLSTTYDAGQASATVTITLGGGAVPQTTAQVSAAHELTKWYCLMALQALWTSGIPLSRTMVVVEGPTQDEYANLVDQPYGVVQLSAGSARRIDWTVVTADSAWSQFDAAFLRAGYVVVV